MSRLYAFTLIVSAALLFSIQLLFGKLLLPLLGGTPAVWNTCMVFFQALLLAGYAYAHVSTQRLPPKAQVGLHLGLLAVAAAVCLPLRLPGWVPPTETNPIPWLLALLAVALGLPFFVLSASAPLLQRWYALAGARNPYVLYVASNVGSLLGLLSYPFLLEPTFTLVQQRLGWTVGYGLLGALTALCGWRLLHGTPAAAPSPSGQSPAPEATPAAFARLHWVILAFVPSSLMLGVTTYLSTDIAAIPLLWMLPLALYLLTFILTFAARPPVSRRFMLWLQPFVLLPLIVAIVIHRTNPWWLLMGLHLLMFFVTAMVCHRELADAKPSPQHLTAFYLWLSVGGVLGGLFNALLAPVLFDTPLEYPLVMVLAGVLRPGLVSPSRWLQARRFDYLFPATVAVFVLWMNQLLDRNEVAPAALRTALLYLPPALACYLFRYRPIRFGLGLMALFLAGVCADPAWRHLRFVERSFFGVYRVYQEGPYHTLHHGTTLHGTQSLAPARRREPLTYYHPTGPLGDIFQAFETAGPPRLRRVGVVGLGTGTTACYGVPGQAWTFYEIDPLVLRIAQDPQLFTYLSDCLERYEVVLGDARLSLEQRPAASFDLLVLDAFSSDAIPVHLITREALQLYTQKLSPEGLLAFHISNRYLDLDPVLARLAAVQGWQALRRSDDELSEAQKDGGKTASAWVVLGKEPEILARLNEMPQWQQWKGGPPSAQEKLWTDDYSALLDVFRWHW